MNLVVTLCTDRPQLASGEFRVGVRSIPYLSDHGFQDMVVLPGSFYEMALCVEHEVSSAFPVPCGMSRSTIHHSFGGDTVVAFSDRAQNGRVEYTFYESVRTMTVPVQGPIYCGSENDRSTSALRERGANHRAFRLTLRRPSTRRSSKVSTKTATSTGPAFKISRRFGVRAINRWGGLPCHASTWRSNHTTWTRACWIP
jgi:hypothetical protein